MAVYVSVLIPHEDAHVVKTLEKCCFRRVGKPAHLIAVGLQRQSVDEQIISGGVIGELLVGKEFFDFKKFAILHEA